MSIQKLFEKLLEVSRSMGGTQDRLELLETDIPSEVKIPKKRNPWAVAAIAVPILLTAIGLGYITYDRFFYAPKHHKIRWEVYHPSANGGKPVKQTGMASVKEGIIPVKLNALKRKEFGQCVVTKEKDGWYLQAAFPNTTTITFEDRVGNRVGKGCSEARVRLYEIKCCWINEDNNILNRNVGIKPNM